MNNTEVFSIVDAGVSENLLKEKENVVFGRLPSFLVSKGSVFNDVKKVNIKNKKMNKEDEYKLGILYPVPSLLYPNNIGTGTVVSFSDYVGVESIDGKFVSVYGVLKGNYKGKYVFTIELKSSDVVLGSINFRDTVHPFTTLKKDVEITKDWQQFSLILDAKPSGNLIFSFSVKGDVVVFARNLKIDNYMDNRESNTSNYFLPEKGQGSFLEEMKNEVKNDDFNSILKDKAPMEKRRNEVKMPTEVLHTPFTDEKYSVFDESSLLVTISSTVYDENGAPLEGVNVLDTLDKTNGVVTDKNGNFEISSTLKSSLRFSYMGYKTQYVPFRKNLPFVFLKRSNTILDEVFIPKKKSNHSIIAIFLFVFGYFYFKH